MIKVKITRATVAGGKAVSIGDVVDLNDEDAQFLIAIKKAVKAKEAKESKGKK